MALSFAAPHESGYGPTRSFCGIIAYVGCLRTSGLVLLAARLSESDPEPTFGSFSLFSSLWARRR
jgi:hypothetical protein